MNTQRILGVALVLVAGFCGCKSADGVEGNGELRSEPRTVEQFVRIDHRGSYDVLVRPGLELSVQVQVDGNLFDKITVAVENGTLVLGETERIDPEVEDPHVVVTVPSLEQVTTSATGDVDVAYFEYQGPIRLTATGEGDIDFDGKAPLITAESTGFGDVELHGSADVLEITETGAGEIDADEMVAGEIRRK